MKKLFIVVVILACVASVALNSCNTPAQKVENAQENVKEAKEDLNAANDAYLADIESYRKETADKIEANNKSIAEFNARIEKEKLTAKEDYAKKISLLQQRNTDLKKKLDDYKADSKEKWQAFKAELSHDMDELAQSFKDFTVKNNK